ncbi:F-box protein At-B isoform X1 [Alnus glutinosa]|uniref:F-box protein At-B isoform X1 n=1 Tax=Alnus glutinosa TaxID=3517 RepID=UPI002D771E33|nr:F-box protein At-B isoform X1 [Alnus glutinosa]
MELEAVPFGVMVKEVLLKLDTETLCSVACVSRALRFSVSQALPLLSSLHLSAFSPDAQTLAHILYRCSGLNCLTLNCLRLDDSSLGRFLGPHLQELNLLSCSLLSYQILASIGETCPNLRVLMLELVEQESPEVFKSNLARMLSGCLYLESLCLKIRGTDVDASAFQSVQFFLPKTLRILKLHPVLEQDGIQLISKLQVDRTFSETADFCITFSPLTAGFSLQCLSLVLDIISDELIILITNSLPLLIELDLEDRPHKEPLLHHDLTNNGLQSLGFCHRLTSLSLIRSRRNHQVSFKRINDMGMFLLSEGCKGLESVRLCGFSRVSDAGFASILHSCQRLKKFEVRNALFLSDLAFHDLTGVPCPLVEVRLLSCSLITSETVKKLACSRSLEVLDLCGCKSIANSCLSSISCLHRLTSVNLSGADVTNYGLSILGQGSPPITHLCIRGCKRVTDEGLSLLLHGGGTISKSLSALDLGHMPGISDKAILTIAKAGIGITELCIRYCFNVTDSSVEALAMKRRFQDESKLLRRLDLFNCIGLSVESMRSLKRPSFPGLHWLGIGHTRLTGKRTAVLTEICRERPWLTLCLDGCEMGCHDGWQFHGPDYR